MNTANNYRRSITVVLLSWKRVNEVYKICSQLSNFDIIDEVIVWNNNPEIHLKVEIRKIKVINCSEDFGLFTRFAAASLAKNECILFHDDDIIAPNETLEVLFGYWEKNPFICHSLFGRNPLKGEYSFNSETGFVEIVLTRYVITHRNVCLHALKKTHEFADIPGIPVGNGEDIILSYAAIDYSGKLNKSYFLDFENLVEDDDNAISKRFADHQNHRTKIVIRCRKVFKIKYYQLVFSWLYRTFRKIGIKF